MKKIITLIVIMNILNLVAQVPQDLNYQGILRNAYGAPIANRNISVRIHLIDQSTPYPVAVFLETHQTRTNQYGLFNIKIGDGNILFGDLKRINWGGEGIKVKIYVDENGGSNYHFLGETKFSSVPYAFMSKSTGILQSDMKTVAVAKHYVDFPLNTSAEQSTFNVFADDAMYIPNKINLDGIAIINDNFYTPGDVSLIMSARSNGTWDGKHHPQCTVVLNAVQQGNNRADFTIQNEYSGSNKVKETLRIKYNGNVGIDNTNPQAKLQVSNGDIYIDKIGKGIILKSQNGKCWRVTPNNNGTLVSQLITCP